VITKKKSHGAVTNLELTLSRQQYQFPLAEVCQAAPYGGHCDIFLPVHNKSLINYYLLNNN